MQDCTDIDDIVRLQTDSAGMPNGISLDSEKFGNFASCMFEDALESTETVNNIVEKIEEAVVSSSVIQDMLTPVLDDLRLMKMNASKILEDIFLGCFIYLAIIVFIALSVFYMVAMGHSRGRNDSGGFRVGRLGSILIIVALILLVKVVPRYYVNPKIEEGVDTIYCMAMKHVDLECVDGGTTKAT